jgi:hypothetical protein
MENRIGREYIRNADEIDRYGWAEIFREDKEGRPSIAGYARLFLHAKWG